MLMATARYIKPFRQARAQLTALCHDFVSTIILDRNRPVAILTPVDTVGMHNPGPKDKRLAAARKAFLDALEAIQNH